MKRKSIVVLLVLLLVGILAFTVFACNNNNKQPNNPNTGDDTDKPGGGDDDDDDETTVYEIENALPKLVTGIDKVAATVAEIDSNKEAYLGADIGLKLGITAQETEAIDLDLGLSLKVSVDDGGTNNWALIGLQEGGNDLIQLFVTQESADKEVIYAWEALTGNGSWHKVSVLDVSAEEDGLTGLFSTPGGVEPDSSFNDSNTEGFSEKEGYKYIYSGGLIDRLFGFIDVMVNGKTAIPVYGEDKDGNDVLQGYKPGGDPVIDFSASSPIGALEFMEGFSLNSIVGLVESLNLGSTLDMALHAEDVSGNGTAYEATLNRNGIGGLLGGLSSLLPANIYETLRGLNPILKMVLGMTVGEDNSFIIDENAKPELKIAFEVSDPEDGALEALSISFSNPDIEGIGINLALDVSNIELSGEARTADVDIPENTDDLGLNLGLELDIPAWDESAKIDISINPNAKIGFNKDGKVEIDLSNVDGYAKFNNTVIAEYCTYNIDKVETKGFAIDLGAVYDFIKPLADGATATDLRGNIYFIKCDLDEIVYTAMYPNNGSGANNLSNAAYANEDEATGALAKLISAIKAGVSLSNINNVIGPILTDSNNLVGLLLGLFDGPITLDPALGEDVNGSIKVTADLAELVKYVMNDNLLGGIEDMIKISMYDVSAASTEGSNEDKTPYTLSQILDGQTDLVDVIIDLVYTAMFEAEEDATKAAGFNAYITSLGDSLITREKVVAYAKKLGITLDESVTAADFGNLVAAITYGEKGLSASISILGAKLSLSADLDEYVDVADSIIGGADAGVKEITSWDEFNAPGGLQNALMELAGYAMLNIEAETPAA